MQRIKIYPSEINILEKNNNVYVTMMNKKKIRFFDEVFKKVSKEEFHIKYFQKIQKIENIFERYSAISKFIADSINKFYNSSFLKNE